MAELKPPTLDELKKAYDEGLPQTLLSGVEVVMRPVRPDTLLMSGKLPDILTPLVMDMLLPKKKEADETVFPDEIANPVTQYLSKEREKAEDLQAYIRSIDVVCEAALVDPSIIPYLSLVDRMWIFQLALLPVQVLSRFRRNAAGDVEIVDDESGESLPSESVSTGDGVPVSTELHDSLST